MIGPAVWPPILDRQTHRQTEFVLYRYRLVRYAQLTRGYVINVMAIESEARDSTRID